MLARSVRLSASDRQVTLCLAAVPGCLLCSRVPHTCDDLCEIRAELFASDDEAHRLSHEPFRCHNCSFLLDDKAGSKAYGSRKCRSGLCTERFCLACRQTVLSIGPSDCCTYFDE